MKRLGLETVKLKKIKVNLKKKIMVLLIIKQRQTLVDLPELQLGIILY